MKEQILIVISWVIPVLLAIALVWAVVRDWSGSIGHIQSVATKVDSNNQKHWKLKVTLERDGKPHYLAVPQKDYLNFDPRLGDRVKFWPSKNTVDLGVLKYPVVRIKKIPSQDSPLFG